MKLKTWTRLAVPICGLSISLVFIAGAHGNGEKGNSKNFTPTNVPSANSRITGVAAPNILSPELAETVVAQGSWKLENPDTSQAALTSSYGYDNDLVVTGPNGTAPRMLPAPGDLPNSTNPPHKVEATKTEPDKNTYLILSHQNGPDAQYNYGRHFLFQGHEVGVNGQGYITRINLDADGPHHITLLATKDVNGAALPAIDGSSWYPFSQRLLFTAENGANGGVWQGTSDYPSTVEFLPGLGRGGYEGIQADNHGNLIIVEDVGGTSGPNTQQAKRPNSFVYRFIPYNTSDLRQGGKLQALQLQSLSHPGPIVFGSTATPADTDAAIISPDQKDLATYGKVFQTTWVTIHDTATQGNAAFDANAMAKAASATPFKRPENGQFRPNSNFSEFVFDATGDTNLQTQAGTTYGGFGAVFRLSKLSTGNSGELRLVYLADAAHGSLDNCAFWSDHQIVFVEDAGDTLHLQRNALDSAYIIDLDVDYSNSHNQPIRIIAEGRDASATIDASFSGLAGFQNEGDNEITGFHISDGDASVRGLIGTDVPKPFRGGWRVFYTQQHGDNNTFELLWKADGEDEDDD